MNVKQCIKAGLQIVEIVPLDVIEFDRIEASLQVDDLALVEVLRKVVHVHGCGHDDDFERR